jgi:hypothetical protein
MRVMVNGEVVQAQKVYKVYRDGSWCLGVQVIYYDYLYGTYSPRIADYFIKVTEDKIDELLSSVLESGYLNYDFRDENEGE